MKKRVLQIYYNFLAWATRRYLAKHKPFVIGINGSVGKTSCRTIVSQTLQKVLPSDLRVYSSPKNFNGELGMSLSIMMVEKRNVSVIGMIQVGFIALRRAFKRKKMYDIILLEYGIDRPGEMAFLLSIVKPDISILTKLDAVHSEQFGDPKAIAEEEVLLNKNTKEIVYLNSDDEYAQQLS